MVNNHKALFYYDKIKLRNLNIFWLGFIAYTIGAAFKDFNLINSKFFALLQIVGLGCIFIGTIYTIKLKIENLYLRVLFILDSVWIIILLIRGFESLLNKQFLEYFLLVPEYGGMLYLVPLIILFPKDLIFLKKTFEVILVIGIVYILFDLLYFKDLLSSDRESLRSQGLVEKSFDLGISSVFLLLTLSYHSNKRKLIAIIIVLLMLFFAVFRARRGLILMTSTGIILSVVLYFLNTRKKIVFTYISILMIFLVAITASYYMYKIKESQIFGFILERGKEDSRTSVELYFYDDMKTDDWILGRGINGEYFCPEIQEDLPTNFRSVIETGYLQIILNGGLISLGLFVLISIPAIIKGLFYSKNTLSKAAGLWIFFALISLYPATVATFSLRYLLVWISIGICYSKTIRNIPNEILKKHFLTQ